MVISELQIGIAEVLTAGFPVEIFKAEVHLEDRIVFITIEEQ